jgi:signal transduction histidine kinase
MKASTSVCVLLLGVALVLLRRPSQARSAAAGRLLALAAAAVAVLALVEYLTNRRLGIDQLAYHVGEGAGRSATGHPALATAASLCVLALSLLLLDTPARRLRRCVRWALGAVPLVSLAVLLGRIYHVTLGDPYRTISVPTATSFLLLVAGVTAARPGRLSLSVLTSRGVAGRTARRLLSAAVAVPVFAAVGAAQFGSSGPYRPEFQLTIVVIYTIAVLVAVVTVISTRFEATEAERSSGAAELAAANQELRAANVDLEAFAATVSHDLRTPLRTMSTFARILADDHGAELSEQAMTHLGRVQAAATRMTSLVDDLTALTRAGRQGLAVADVDTAELVARTLWDLSAQHAGRSLEITVDELPACRADPGLLTLVYAHLLSNAIKFTRDRDPAKIEIGSDRPQGPGGETVFFVADNGVGFDPRYEHKLFELFERLQPLDYSGTGVGLALVRRVVERHGGRVWAHGSPGVGATFSFTLGRAEA